MVWRPQLNSIVEVDLSGTDNDTTHRRRWELKRGSMARGFAATPTR